MSNTDEQVVIQHALEGLGDFINLVGQRPNELTREMIEEQGRAILVIASNIDSITKFSAHKDEIISELKEGTEHLVSESEVEKLQMELNEQIKKLTQENNEKEIEKTELLSKLENLEKALGEKKAELKEVKEGTIAISEQGDNTELLGLIQKILTSLETIKSSQLREDNSIQKLSISSKDAHINTKQALEILNKYSKNITLLTGDVQKIYDKQDEVIVSNEHAEDAYEKANEIASKCHEATKEVKETVVKFTQDTNESMKESKKSISDIKTKVEDQNKKIEQVSEDASEAKKDASSVRKFVDKIKGLFEN